MPLEPDTTQVRVYWTKSDYVSIVHVPTRLCDEGYSAVVTYLEHTFGQTLERWELT